MKKLPHFDVKQHLQEWHRYVLPIFVVVAAVFMLVFLIARSGKRAEPEAEDGFRPARIGLLGTGEEAVFDPAFAVTSPIEMVLAPTADTFDYPVGSAHGALTYNAQPFLTANHLGDDLNGIGGGDSDLGDPVYAVADGLVIFAGWPSDGWGNVAMLLHELADGRLVETFYGHLDSIRVPVGRQVGRGDTIGTIGTANGRYLAHLHFEIRRYPTLDAGAGYADSKLGRVSGELALRKWRAREDDQLAGAPRGAPPEPGAFQLEVDGGEPAAP
ncbi:MAG: M23 family metallopeptidase [Verrucomicrobiales bacterium]